MLILSQWQCKSFLPQSMINGYVIVNICGHIVFLKLRDQESSFHHSSGSQHTFTRWYLLRIHPIIFTLPWITWRNVFTLSSSLPSHTRSLTGNCSYMVVVVACWCAYLACRVYCTAQLDSVVVLLAKALQIWSWWLNGKEQYLISSLSSLSFIHILCC